MKNKKCNLLILVVILLSTFTGCKQNTEVKNDDLTSNFYTFLDDTNSEVVVSRKPGKTAVLFSSYADIWLNSGGTVNITVEETVDRGLVDREKVELVGKKVGKEINAEALIAAKPDFVILTADYPEHVELAALLRQSNIPVALFKVDDFNGYLNMLKICTDIMDRPDAYETYGLNVKSDIDEIIEKTKIENNKKTILFIRAYSKGAKAKTTDHFVGQMLEELNTDNIATHAKILLEELSIESIAVEDPDYIFVSTMGDNEEAISYMQKQINDNPVWSSLSAMKNNNYIILPKDLFQYKPNARWAEAYEYITKKLYPEAFINE